MAQAYPEFRAGEGDTIGIHGSSSEWPYIVEVDNEGDDPLTVLFGVAAIGSPHPDPRFAGNVVGDYRKAERLNERFQRIYVLYSSLSDQVIGQWRRSVKFANETRVLARSLANIAPDGETIIDVPLDVGPTKWDVADLSSATVFHTRAAVRAPGTIIDQPVKLLPTLSIDRSKGIEVNDGIMAIGYDNLVPQLSIVKLQRLMSYRWHTNLGPWPGFRGSDSYPRWSLIFSNFAVDDQVLNLPIAGPYWFSAVSIEFLYRPLDNFLNPFGWRGRREPEYYSDDRNFAAQVFQKRASDDAEVSVSKDYVIYPDAQFRNIFNVIGAGQPTF